jgi:hypothetical protein
MATNPTELPMWHIQFRDQSVDVGRRVTIPDKSATVVDTVTQIIVY